MKNAPRRPDPNSKRFLDAIERCFQRSVKPLVDHINELEARVAAAESVAREETVSAIKRKLRNAGW